MVAEDRDAVTERRRELDLEEKVELDKLKQEEARVSAKVAAHEAEIKEMAEMGPGSQVSTIEAET